MDRGTQLIWLQNILDIKGWSSARLALEAKIHPSTLVHFKTDRENKALLESSTIEKICMVKGVMPPSYDLPRVQIDGDESDIIRLNAAPFWFDTTLFDHYLQRDNITAYLIASGCMEASGCPPGFLIFASDTLHARSGDLVIARSFTGREIFRKFYKPFLTSNPFPPSEAEINVWDDQIEILGVVETVASGQRSLTPKLRSTSAFRAILST